MSILILRFMPYIVVFVHVEWLYSYWVSDFQHVLYGVYAAVGLESEILVVEHHPLLSLFAAETFDVREHADRYYNHAAIGQIDSHHPTLLSEVQFLNTQIGVFILAHIYCFLIRFTGICDCKSTTIF